MCRGDSKEPSQWDGSFAHPKHMLKLWVRKYLQFYAEKFCLSKPVIVVSYKLKYLNEVLVNPFVKLAHEKVWLYELTVSTWP